MIEALLFVIVALLIALLRSSRQLRARVDEVEAQVIWTRNKADDHYLSTVNTISGCTEGILNAVDPDRDG